MKNRTTLNCKETKMRLVRIIEEYGLSAKDVQKIIGYGSVQAVYKWESLGNSSLPSIDALVQLAGYFDCEIDDLIVTDKIPA